MVGRVSSYGLGQTMLRQAMSVQSAYASVSAQKSSGLKGTTYADLGSASSSLISTESASAELTTWKTNTQTASDRTQSMLSAVGGIIKQLQSLRSTLSAVKSTTDTSTDLNQVGTDLLSDLADLMNTQMDGRYLFAGSNTRTAPVDVSLVSTPTVPSTADTSYYTGDLEIMSVRISSQQTVGYGVTANSAGFEQSLRTAKMLATMTTSPMDETALNEAYELATDAIDSLIATQSGLGNADARLSAAETRQGNALDLLDSVASDIKGVDVAAASVKLSQYETQLTASYSALASVSKFSLVNYL